jgi:hypothetical protein
MHPVPYDSPRLSRRFSCPLLWMRPLLPIGAICSALLTACAFITPGDLAQLREDKQKLDAMTKQQQTEIAALQAKLRAGKAQLQALKERQTFQQRKLHATTRQAVRAETMLHGLGCAPCAASRIAEVETALSARPSNTGPARSNRAVSQARRLLQLSSQEYQHGNYARSTELADEAYQLIEHSPSGAARNRLAR